MIDKLEKQEARYHELEQLLCDLHVLNDQKRYRELSQEFADLSELIAAFRSYKKLLSEIQNAEEMAAFEEDAALKTLAREELKELEEQKSIVEKQLRSLLTPCDPMDAKNIIVEIRAGTGGEEAALFACDLFRLYSRYAENQGWKLEIIDANSSELGGYKEIIFSISGKNVFGQLRWESGGHRVQRIPLTEANGRIQTSAATVAVFPEAEETDVEILDKDIKIDIFRSSGPGGQSVNTTDSAVRVTHLPTGLVATCQDEKSQLKNKQKALKVLRARLLEMEASKKAAERSAERKSQVGSGDRSDRIRTYNFPQNRLTDHRANLSFYHLDRIMEGELTDVIEALKLHAQQQDLK